MDSDAGKISRCRKITIQNVRVSKFAGGVVCLNSLNIAKSGPESNRVPDFKPHRMTMQVHADAVKNGDFVYCPKQKII